MLPSASKIDIREYRDANGRNPFGEWFRRLSAEAAKKVTTALFRVSLGNFSNAKSVGSGVCELKVNFGPGYRVYFGTEEERIIVLLRGGTKQGQQNDIRVALEYWDDHKRMKKQKDEE
jgi:putative addiction module killer protein